MCYNVCGSYKDPDRTNKKIKDYNTSKSGVRKHEGAQIFIYCYNTKGEQTSIKYL